ncbi:MAG: hypothetical protein DRI34_00720 [Deltaproteobacteria bacterium]|nr:MAG: hypothetical protein DRI34_00720 [Deltaproteobacteria bacterium]
MTKRNVSGTGRAARLPYLFIVLLGLAGGTAALLLGGTTWHSAGLGWGLACLLGLAGWWGISRALAVDLQRLMRAVFGGMLVRLAVSGLLLGLVVGLTALSAEGFVGGLLGGFLVFMFVEIVAIERHARRGTATAGVSDNA